MPTPPGIYAMLAKENYSPDLVAAWHDTTQPNFCFCDKQYIGTSFDRVRRNIMYSATITDKTPVEGNVPQTNITGQTLWSGLGTTPNGNKLDLNFEFVFQTAVKNIDSGDVTFYPSYDPAELVPAGKGAGGITGFTITGGHGPDDGTFPGLFFSGGTGDQAQADMTFVAGVLTAVVFWNIGYGYTVGDVLTVPGGATGTITITSVNTGSNGTTWGRSVAGTSLTGGDVTGICDPRNGNFWVPMKGFGPHLFRPGKSFVMDISPLKLPFSVADNRLAKATPLGVTANWVFSRAAKLVSSNIFTNVMQILPATITPAEVAADALLATYTYNYPDNTYCFRHAVGPDSNLYVFGAKVTGTRAYKLWKCVPGAGFTDITPWAGGTGPNTDCASWTTNGSLGSTRNYMIQMPATGDLALISKLRPSDYSTPGTDPTKFRIDCTYFHLAGATFDYHQQMVYGYMDADWNVTDLAGAAWQVLDFLEFDNDLEASDYIHSGVDYSLRRLAFICYAVVDGALVDSHRKLVFVDYQFTYGAAPQVVKVTPETGWDDKYPAYAATITQNEVVAGSLPVVALASNNTRYTDFASFDNGIWDREKKVMWLSGDNPQFCLFDIAFSGRETQALVSWDAATSAASPPFLTFSVDESGQHPNIQPWTFELDGHEFYVLQMQEETLVYDFFAEHWYVWGNESVPLWAAQHGQNWNANLGNVIANLGGERVSNVICGDRLTGALYFLDPELNEDYDSNGNPGQAFQRTITGQLVSRSQDYTPLYGVEVTASDGEDVIASDLTVTLEYSDDHGHTYNSFGSKDVVLGEYSAVLQWYSLGAYKAPGRLLRLTDYGALVRVDDWTIPDDTTEPKKNG